MWAVIHRTDGGRLLFARKADLPRLEAAISGSAGWNCRSLVSLPPSPAQPARRRIGACPVVGARPAAIRPSNAACPRHGDRRRNPRPTGRGCKVLELSGARVESFALQTGLFACLIEHVSPHGGIDFLTYQLSTSVGGSGPRGEPWSHRAVDAPHGIRAIMARPRWLRTTDSRHDFPIAPNLLERNFTAAAPNRIWLADVTYIETD
jgi:hypothetical protein